MPPPIKRSPCSSWSSLPTSSSVGFLGFAILGILEFNRTRNRRHRVSIRLGPVTAPIVGNQNCRNTRNDRINDGPRKAKGSNHPRHGPDEGLDVVHQAAPILDIQRRGVDQRLPRVDLVATLVELVLVEDPAPAAP